FYNRQLFRFISEFALDNHNFSTHDIYFILRQNWNFKFIDYNLLSHFASLIESKDEAVFGENSRIDVTELLRLFTLSSNRDKIRTDFTQICENIRSSRGFQLKTSQSRMAYFFFLQNCLLLNVELDESLVREWLAKYLQSAFEE